MESPQVTQSPQSPKGLDEKFCESCGQIINIKAEICPKCGIRLKNYFDKTSLLLLTFFLGGLGAHKFYLRKNIQGILYILFCWTFIPGTISFFEFLIYAFTNNEKLNEKYSASVSKASTVAIAIIVGGVGFVFVTGVFAALAVPKFASTIAKAKASEFPVALRTIFTYEQAYIAENGRYSSDFNEINMDYPESKYFIYSIDNVSEKTFTAHAVVKLRFGQVSVNEEATIDQDGNKTAAPSLLKYNPTWK